PLEKIIEINLPPIMKVLLVLSIAVGLPYFFLSTTSTILQYWYGRLFQKDIAYRLYAVSNAASLFALLSYPFLVEPFVSLRLQGKMWFVGYALYTVLILLSAWEFFALSRPPKPVKTAKENHLVSGPLRKNTALLWLWISTLPTFMLVATTSQVTQSVSAVPLLWVLPLSLYLLSFIISFSGWKIPWFLPLVLIFFCLISLLFSVLGSNVPLLGKLTVDFSTLLLTGLVLHSRLYEMRPAQNRSPLFYLVVSFGGVLGSLFGSIVVPVIFDSFLEFKIGLLLVSVTILFVLGPQLGLVKLNPAIRKLFYACAIFPFLLIFFYETWVVDNNFVFRNRNFYGLIIVQDSLDKKTKTPLRKLISGNVVHGVQTLGGRVDSSSTYYSYYSRKSGVGKTFRYLTEKSPKDPLRVGVIGLGAGEIANYCRPGDEFVFYEIDPDVFYVAKKYFTHLTKCEKIAVEIGDARVVLQKEGDEGKSHDYDFLIMDAFSDDAIPIHLITKEAFELYKNRLKPGGIIAVNTTNSYINYPPLIHALAREYGFFSTTVLNDATQSPGEERSQWVLLTKDPQIFKSRAMKEAPAAVFPPFSGAAVKLWTDNYVNLLPFLKFP
ncbi:MAG: hypothetical protein A2Z11_04225, partial [Candidatus Woykebacteria bacterium RBG_16_43_9]